MPKIKTKSGTKKRFKTTGTGKVAMFSSGKRHNLTKRTKKNEKSGKRSCYNVKARYKNS